MSASSGRPPLCRVSGTSCASRASRSHSFNPASGILSGGRRSPSSTHSTGRRAFFSGSISTRRKSALRTTRLAYSWARSASRFRSIWAWTMAWPSSSKVINSATRSLSSCRVVAWRWTIRLRAMRVPARMANSVAPRRTSTAAMRGARGSGSNSTVMDQNQTRRRKVQAAAGPSARATRRNQPRWSRANQLRNSALIGTTWSSSTLCGGMTPPRRTKRLPLMRAMSALRPALNRGVPRWVVGWKG